MKRIKLSSFFYRILFFSISYCSVFLLHASTYEVGKGKQFPTIQSAIDRCVDGDTVIVFPGLYKDGNILIRKSITVIGKNLPVLDGELKYEVVTINAENVVFKGFKIQNSKISSIYEPAGIRIVESYNVKVKDNVLKNNFYGIYIQNSVKCEIRNNTLFAEQVKEARSGNGIHGWKSDSILVIGNKIQGHRDGIYFEFVTNSLIWRNISYKNLRYGLHFMFSHHNSYITNVFKNNGAGVAVMYTKNVTIINNTFEENWGDASFGMMFKDLSGCYIHGNKFINNSTGIYLDAANRNLIENNTFKDNGWGMRLLANCMDNKIIRNNFYSNTFDVATNGSLTLNYFHQNYWDKYEGYDLDRNLYGDIPFRPLSLFSVIVEKNPPAMLLFRSFMITLLDNSEKIIPSLTPENFIDNSPKMTPYKI